MSDSSSYQADLQRIIDSARRLGVELDEADALQWLTAVTAAHADEVVVDEHSGTFGHQVAMLDFDDADLAHFRKIGRLVEFADAPGKVETALALSGSAAQSKVQTYPGDCDFFERVNILAPTREAACQILGGIMREKALSTLRGPDHTLIEVKLGSYPFDMERDGHQEKAGKPIAWTPEEIQAGRITGVGATGEAVEVTWEAAAREPGWCKLDWVVADTVRKQVVNASNMLDVTWEAPDGSITPLDGYLDSYFQEIYLDANSIPVFSKLVKHVSGDALDNYVGQLTNEVKKYVTKDTNYGKAAKRLYNIFRLTGRYAEAAYLRELFDEPTTMLYQVWSLIRTIDDTFSSPSEIDVATLLNQADQLILAVIEALEGVQEVEIVRLLLRFRGLVEADAPKGELSPPANAARAELINVVNNFFYEKLTGVPEIRAFIEELQQG